MATMNITRKLQSLHYPLNLETRDMIPELLKPFKYFTSVPGKKIRQNLIHVLAHWIPVAEDKLPIIDDLVHYIHNASLLIDDIQDVSDLRRGVPTTHTIYGIPRTIYSVNYIQCCVCDILDGFNNIELTKMYSKTSEEILAGQGMDLYWRDNFVCPTEAEYLQMIYRKTALVFVLVQTVMNFLATGKKVPSTRLLTNLGIYFQINDDYQNLKNDLYYDSKGFCEDITEGKFSFPIVHAINNFPKEGKEIMVILRERTYDVELKKQCLTILEKCGSFEYTKKVLTELKKAIHEEVAKLDENPLIYDYIDKAMLTCL